MHCRIRCLFALLLLAFFVCVSVESKGSTNSDIDLMENSPFKLSEEREYLFFDFTNMTQDRLRYARSSYNGLQFDESTSNWHSSKVELSMNNGADCASDGRMLAYGTLKLTPIESKSTRCLSVQTGVDGACGLKYAGNKDDIYAEVRVKANGFDRSSSGIVMIYPCKEDGSTYIQPDGSNICLSATFSAADLTAGDYVVLQFTNATQFVHWQSLDTIHNITIAFSYDGIDDRKSITYDYIYIGSARQNHVMMDFSTDSPANTASHWTVHSTTNSRHSTTGPWAEGDCLYGTTSLDDSDRGYSLITTENQFRYTVQTGDIVKMRIKLSRNASKGGTLDGMYIGMGIGGPGYWSSYKGAVLNIPVTQLWVDGLYHEYSISIPDSANMIGNPLRSLFFGFIGQNGYTLDFEIDYIYVGSAVNFSAYTGRSTVIETPIPAEDDVKTTDNALLCFRLFNYNRRVNDNAPVSGTTLESCFPFRDEYMNKDFADNRNHFYEASSSTVMPYLSADGYPMIRDCGGQAPVSLGYLFGTSDAVGVHSYTPVNSLLTFDGETYSYDSTKHAVDYDTATDRFYVRREAGDGFTPFSYGKETDSWFGFTLEMSFVQMRKDAVLMLSCIDDAWVFIDGVLVLDLGGADVCKVGSIQFDNGEIIAAAGDQSRRHSLLQRYQDAGRQAVTSWNGSTFAEGSVHTLKIFFLDRSTKGTQCKLSFNLSPASASARYEFDGDLFPTNNGLLNDFAPPFPKKNHADSISLWEEKGDNDFRYADIIPGHAIDWNNTVIRSNDHAKAGLYRAISQRHVYATANQSFRLYYDMQINGHSYQMGDIAKFSENAPILAVLELYYPDGEAIGAVELIGADGAAIYSTSIDDSYAYLEIPLSAEQPYYYVCVVNIDNQHTVSAPIWLEKCNNHTPITDAPLPPSCTGDGRTEGSHCSQCYASILEQMVIPATGHSHTYTDNGISHIVGCETCNYSTEEDHGFIDSHCICGATEPVEPAVDEGIHIRHALNLESSIVLNYVVAVTELSEYDSFYLQCILPEFDNHVQIGTYRVEIQPVLKGDYYYFPLSDLSAVRMNDAVEATVFMSRDGISYRSVVDIFCIADYAYGMLNNDAAEDSLKVLCANLLRYGSEAQCFKGYRTDAPADAKMTIAQRAYLSDTSDLQFNGTDVLLGDVKNPSITWIGKTLSLDTKVGIKLVFDAKGYASESLTVKLHYRDYTGGEKTVILRNPTVYNASEGYFAVTCYDLPAAELRTVVTAAIYDGEQQLSESLQYSAESYAARTAGTTLEPLCRALFAYSDSAYSYFAK